MDKSKLIIAGLAGAVLIAGGVLVLANMNNEDNSDQTTMNTSETSQMTDNEQSSTSEQAQPTSSIVDLAVATSSLSTLTSAVTAADLVTTLNGTGPFTVFAPTNDAFAKLPAGTLDTLLKPENKTTLQGILTYHVVAGKVMSNQLKDGQVITTVQGNTLTVKIADGKVMLTDAKGGMATVAQADIEASNGVVHVIDSVVLPQ